LAMTCLLFWPSPCPSASRNLKRHKVRSRLILSRQTQSKMAFWLSRLKVW
jgi:hypothetical protein